MINITTPLTIDIRKKLKVGDEVVDGSIAGKMSELKNILVK